MSFNKGSPHCCRRRWAIGVGPLLPVAGFDVVATDPAPNAESNLRKYVDDAWPALAKAGLVAGASRDRLTFTASMSRALAEADHVQENAPERPEFKVKLFAEMDEVVPADSIIASSSSGITMESCSPVTAPALRDRPPSICPIVPQLRCRRMKTSETIGARGAPTRRRQEADPLRKHFRVMRPIGFRPRSTRRCSILSNRAC